MIETKSLSKNYSKFSALQDISISLSSGCLTGIIGPNGSGKSTLMKCILGLVRPSSGIILYNGHLPDTNGMYRKHIGYMPQQATFPNDSTGREVLSMITNLRKEVPTHMQVLIDLFDLNSQLDKRIRTLSGGTRQKLSFIVAEMYQPSLLILDEPTAGLDPGTREVFRNYINDCRTRNCSILMTTHIISDLEEIADDVILLLDGSVQYAGSVPNLKLTAQSTALATAVARKLKNGAV